MPLGKLAIAVDFGTARTKVAYRAHPGDRPELLLFGHEHERSFTPSLFYLPRGDGPPLFGDTAEEMLADNPTGVIDVLKRQLREPRIRRQGRTETPERLIGFMLRELRRKAGREIAAFAGAEPDVVALTVPAGWAIAERELLERAAHSAGFETVTVVEEPVAAARAWLNETGQAADAVVVLDCGGGTVDWAYLKREGARFHVVPNCPPGNIADLGGHDVDLGLLALVEAAFSEDPTALAELEERRARILAQLRRLKEDVARGKEPRPLRVADRTVALDSAAVAGVVHERLTVRVAAGFANYLRAVREQRSGDLPPVLLVGGSSRFSALEEAIRAIDCRTVSWERADFAPVLGAAIMAGESVGEVDYANAPDVYLEEHARAGGHDAAFELGRRLLGLASASSDGDALYALPYGLTKTKQADPAGGLRWLLRAAEGNHLSAQALLGRLYLRGVGVKADVPTARIWLEKAAEAGDLEAQTDLGALLAGFVPGSEASDTKRALELFRRATDAGNVQAKTHLGRLLLQTKPLDAVAYFAEAAERGNGDAAYELGQLYLTGEVVQKDKLQAEHWFTKAAELKHPAGKRQHALIVMQYNKETGMNLLDEASKLGDEQAASLLEKERNRITSEREKLAREEKERKEKEDKDRKEKRKSIIMTTIGIVFWGSILYGCFVA